MKPPRTTAERLKHGVALLALIDARRAKTNCASVGAGIERCIIERELRELEGDLSADGSTDAFAARRRVSG
jgi:hypothetical protein